MTATKYPKSMLILLAGGYSTRLNLPKQTLQTSDGKYLFERMIENSKTESLVVITNRLYSTWWSSWFSSRGKGFGIPISILVEPHDRPEGAYGVARYLTSNVPITFSNAKEYIISPIDSYYADFDFFSKLNEKDNAIVVAKYPDEYLKQMGVVRTNWKGDLVNFVEKPEMLDDASLLSQYWVFTGLVKLQSNVVVSIGQQRSKNIGEYVKLLIDKGLKLDVIKYKGFYRDVGISEVYADLVAKSILKAIKT